MKAAEIRAMTDAEALEKLAALRKELAKEKETIASGTRPEKPLKIRNIRRDIARILTILNERKKKEKKDLRSKTKEVKE